MDDRTEIENRIDIDSFIAGLPMNKRIIARMCEEGETQMQIASRMKLSQQRVSQIIKEFGSAFIEY